MATESKAYRDRIVADWITRYGVATIPAEEAVRVRVTLLDFAAEILLTTGPTDPRINEILTRYGRLVS